MAGGVTGNLRPFWTEYMKIYQVGTWSRPFLIEEAARRFLKEREKPLPSYQMTTDLPYVLESYYYIQESIPFYRDHREHFKDFMLDSGAFTFMNKQKKEAPNWTRYIDRYSEAIKELQCSQFLELDLDSIMPLKDVEKLRRRLETRTQFPCIPVWHKSRGLDYWKGMVKDYELVAIGGIVTKEIKKEEFPIFVKLIQIAKENDCRVHGLGFTRLELLPKIKFDSVDSTAWLAGNMGGFLYHFDGRNMRKIERPAGKKINGRKVAMHNFNEWIKFGKYAEQYY